MSWFESLVLGLVQGLTEFLPVSSSAHLRLTAAFSGRHDPGAAFTAITQIGTEAAVLIYFRKDIGRIISAWTRPLVNKEMRGDPDARMGWLVIVGSIPIGVLGVTLKDQIEGRFATFGLPRPCSWSSAWSSASPTGWRPATRAAAGTARPSSARN
ncbi:Undecaprenyl-diphosphatase [Streptomyces fumanus]